VAVRVFIRILAYRAKWQKENEKERKKAEMNHKYIFSFITLIFSVFFSLLFVLFLLSGMVNQRSVKGFGDRLKQYQDGFQFFFTTVLFFFNHFEFICRRPCRETP
jgi:hypothetical protein